MDALKILGQVMSSGALGSGGAQNLLGGLLGGGGAGGALGGLLGGGAGGAGGALGGLLGGGQASGGAGSAGFGKKAVMGALGGLAVAALMKHMRNKGMEAQARDAGLQDFDQPALSDRDVNDRAELMIRAMVGAAKSDGRIDKQEESQLMQQFGDLDREEQAFLRQELSRPADAANLARSVPGGMEQEIYAMSLMSIELDDKVEAQYLLDLAKGLSLSGDQCNQIHEQLDQPKIFN